jgi:P-type Cu+ transporter
MTQGTCGERTSKMEKDPVCGMDVDPKSAAGSRDHEGKTYHFCSPSCMKEFEKKPSRYVSS